MFWRATDRASLQTKRELLLCVEGQVLFSCDSRVVAADSPHKLDLFYWDGLAGQEELITLTVDAKGFEGGARVPDVNDERALTPPLDFVIRSKWNLATVDWNDSEPIL